MGYGETFVIGAIIKNRVSIRIMARGEYVFVRDGISLKTLSLIWEKDHLHLTVLIELTTMETTLRRIAGGLQAKNKTETIEEMFFLPIMVRQNA